MQVYADYTDEALGKPNLEIKFVDADTVGAVSEPVSTLGFKAQTYKLPYLVGPETREGMGVLKMQNEFKLTHLLDNPHSLQYCIGTCALCLK
jgi:hypothetical protein